MTAHKKNRMAVDVAPFSNFILIYAIAAAILVIVAIIEAAGPSPIISNSTYAYDCVNNSHVWSKDYCTGEEPKYVKRKEKMLYFNVNYCFFHVSQNESTVFTVFSGELNRLNKFWFIGSRPFNKEWKAGGKDMYVKMHLGQSIQSSMYSSSPDGPWTPYVSFGVMKTLECPIVTKSARSSGGCRNSLYMFAGPTKHKYYKVDLSFFFTPKSPGFELGDIEFTVYKGSIVFSRLVITWTILLIALSVAALAYTAIAIYRNTAPCTFEQGCLLILLGGAIVYTNPFLFLEYFSYYSMTLKVFDSILKSVFISVLFLFWLFVTKKMCGGRDTHPNPTAIFTKENIPEFVYIALFCIYSIVVSALEHDAEMENPFGSFYAWQVTMYAFNVIALFVPVVFVVVMVVRKIGVITDSKVTFKRFLFFAIPSAIVVVSMFAYSFRGSFGVYLGTCKYSSLLSCCFQYWICSFICFNV